MEHPDAAVFLDRDFKWYWCFNSNNNDAVDKSREGYPTRAEAWRAVSSYLLSLLNKKC